MPGQSPPPFFLTSEIVVFSFFSRIFARVPHNVTRGDAAFSPSMLPHKTPTSLYFHYFFASHLSVTPFSPLLLPHYRIPKGRNHSQMYTDTVHKS